MIINLCKILSIYFEVLTFAAKHCGSLRCVFIVGLAVFIVGLAVFIVGLHRVHCGSTPCSLWVYSMFIVGLLHLHCGSTPCSLWVYSMFIVGLLHVHCGSTPCSLWVYAVFVLGLRRVHSSARTRHVRNWCVMRVSVGLVTVRVARCCARAVDALHRSCADLLPTCEWWLVLYKVYMYVSTTTAPSIVTTSEGHVLPDQVLSIVSCNLPLCFCFSWWDI